MTKEKNTVWVSALIPLRGADLYEGVRIEASTTEREALVGLAEWTEECFIDADGNEFDNYEDLTDDQLRAILNDSDQVLSWKVEECWL